MTEYTRWDSFERRFWGRVEKTNTCWNWTGRLTPKGYGVDIKLNDVAMAPHRASYLVNVGHIPDGLVIDHLCRNRRCVNPAHLEPVTAIENTARGVDARWVEPCPNGHDPAEHRRTIPSGKTICVACRRDSDRARDERNRDKRRAAARARYQSRRAAA